MGTNIKSEFAVMCKQLRQLAGLKHREVAAAIGVALSTYGNVESSPHKVINRQRAIKLVDLYRLSPDRAAELLTKWDTCPLSPFGQKRAKYWERRNKLRNKAKNHDPLKFACSELLGIVLMDRADDQVCECSDGAPRCTVCYALERIGVTSPFTPADRDQILTQLAKIRDDLMPARQAEAPPPEPAADEIFGG